MIKALILSLILDGATPWPNHPLNKDPAALADTEQALEDAAEKYGIDPVLLTLWGYLESSLIQTRIGKLGEIGVFQIHGTSSDVCKSAGLNIHDRRENILCGAMLVDMSRRYCGSKAGVSALERGLRRYASGRCEGTPRARRKVSWRLRELDRWKRRLGAIR